VFLSIRTCFVSVDSNLLCLRRFELGFAKIRINDQECSWTPAGLVGRLRVSVDSNLAAPGFELTASDVAGHPSACAVQRARRILVGVEALMLEFTMQGETTEHPIEWLRKTIDELIRKDEFERKQRQDFFSRILEEASKRLEAPLEVIEFKKAAATPRKSAKPRLVGLPAKRISEVITAYVIENRVRWREKSREENQFLLNLIVSVLGDRKVGSLTLEDMRIYKEAVLSIPKHRSKLPKYRNLSVKELLQMEIPEEERLSARNALKYLSRARTFFTWGRLKGYVKEDIGIVLTYKLPEREKRTGSIFAHRSS
jgi:hypothetical protein